MKPIFVITLVLLSLSAFAGSSTRETLQAIADNAQLGNGSASVTKKAPMTGKEMQKFLSTLKKEWSNCTFTRPTSDPKKAFRFVNDQTGDSSTSDAINELIRQGKVASIYEVETDNDIACSQAWINVYTTDGFALEMWFGMGD